MACRVCYPPLRGGGKCRQESAEAIVAPPTEGEGPNFVLRAGAFAVREAGVIEDRTGMCGADAEEYRAEPGRGRMSMTMPPLAKGELVPKPLQLMERVVERSNMQRAYNRVKQNKGAPGLDGMNVSQLGSFLCARWPKIKERLCEGSYVPKPVKRVNIPKASGGLRPLGIPTVLDRLIQQALHQMISPLFEPEFSEHSFGFRPGRSAHQAVLQAKQYQHDGETAGWWTWIWRSFSTKSTTRS